MVVNNIPNNFLIEKELSDEQKRILIEQMNRFERLKESYRNISNPVLDNDGCVVLPSGSIIHGIKRYDEVKLDNISKTGILTGQAVGISEDCETFYCADFHRVPNDISLKDYNLQFKSNDGRCPFGSVRADKSFNMAFVVTPNESNRELLSYDCYREGTVQSEITRSFINFMPLSKEAGSSILYGVPANCIEGVIVGGEIISDKNKIDFLVQRFPHCYIASAHGELIYNPSKKEVLGDEVIELRRKLALKECAYRKEVNEKKRVEDNYSILMNNWEDLLSSLYRNGSVPEIINILGGTNNWKQGVSENFVVNMKDYYHQQEQGRRGGRK